MSDRMSMHVWVGVCAAALKNVTVLSQCGMSLHQPFSYQECLQSMRQQQISGCKTARQEVLTEL